MLVLEEDVFDAQNSTGTIILIIFGSIQLIYSEYKEFAQRLWVTVCDQSNSRIMCTCVWPIRNIVMCTGGVANEKENSGVRGGGGLNSL